MGRKELLYKQEAGYAKYNGGTGDLNSEQLMTPMILLSTIRTGAGGTGEELCYVNLCVKIMAVHRA